MIIKIFYDPEISQRSLLNAATFALKIKKAHHYDGPNLTKLNNNYLILISLATGFASAFLGRFKTIMPFS